jgi:hypothetical protein
MRYKFGPETMGLFGTDIQNVAVAQSGSKQTAVIEIPVSIWEVIIISLIVVLLVVLFLRNLLKIYLNKKINKQAKIGRQRNNIFLFRYILLGTNMTFPKGDSYHMA